MTIIDDIQFDDDDSDNTHAYDDDHSVLRLATVVCWLEQTSSAVLLFDWGTCLAHRAWHFAWGARVLVAMAARA